MGTFLWGLDPRRGELAGSGQEQHDLGQLGPVTSPTADGKRP
jgi:hypothetical protein